jgi:serine beta-lactamase-like protein LACTB, mitochondrial
MLRATLAVLLPSLILPLSGQDLAALSRYLDSERGKLKIPGYVAGIYYKGDVIWTRATGVADLAGNRLVRRDTPFRIASISKSLTAVGMLSMAEMRMLNLTDDVRKYCPAFPAKQHPVNLQQLLWNLGGVRSYRTEDPTDANNTIHYTSVTQAIQKFAADPLVHVPGTKFLYTTYGYNLLGCAIEGAAGMPYEKWMLDKVFATVGMCNTVPDNGKGLSARRAKGYRKTAMGEIEDCAASDNTAKIPGGGWVSTVDDLLKFAEGIFREQLLRSESIDLMWTSAKLKSGAITGYGMGWSLAKAPEGDREIYHTGGQQGASTILYMRPEHDFAFVWLTNLEGVENRLPISRRIFKLATQKPELGK